MQAYPHIYKAHAHGPQAGEVDLGGRDLAPIATSAPPEFDGPPGHWSPEMLLTAAVADCFVLSFRAVAPWQAVPTAVE